MNSSFGIRWNCIFHCFFFALRFIKTYLSVRSFFYLRKLCWTLLTVVYWIWMEYTNSYNDINLFLLDSSSFILSCVVAFLCSIYFVGKNARLSILLQDTNLQITKCVANKKKQTNKKTYKILQLRTERWIMFADASASKPTKKVQNNCQRNKLFHKKITNRF